MTQTLFQSFRKFGFQSFKSKQINQNETIGEHYKKHILSEFGSVAEPSCMDFNDEAGLIAIGNKKGSIKIFGRPGVNIWANETDNEEIFLVKFIKSTQFLVSLSINNRISLWYYSNQPQNLQLVESFSDISDFAILTERPTILQDSQYSETKDIQWITALEVFKSISCIIVGDARGFIMRIPLHLNQMKASNSMKPLKTQDLWTKPTKHDIISLERLISKLPTAVQSRHEITSTNQWGAVTHLSQRPGQPMQILIGWACGDACLYDIKRDLVLSCLLSPMVTNPTNGGVSNSPLASRYANATFTWQPSQLRQIDSFLATQQYNQGNPAPLIVDTSDVVFAVLDTGSMIRWNFSESKNIVAGSTSCNVALNEDQIFPYSSKQKCLPITKMIWRKNKNNEDLYIFAGGLPRAEYLTHESVTITTANQMNTPLQCDPQERVVFDLSSPLVDMITIDDNQGDNIAQYLILLTEEEIICLDLLNYSNQSEWIRIIPQPYLKCIHHSPITAHLFLPNVPQEWFDNLLEPQLAQESIKSIGDWPISGNLSNQSQNVPVSPDDIWLQDLLITGHCDGSLIFWRLGHGGCMQKLRVLSTVQGIFKNVLQNNNYYDNTELNDPTEVKLRRIGVFDQYSDDNRMSIQLIKFDGTYLSIGGFAGQVIVWHFTDQPIKDREPQILEVDLTTHLPNFQWRGCRKLDFVDFSESKSLITNDNSSCQFQLMMLVGLNPPSQITSMDMTTVVMPTKPESVVAVVAFGSLHGIVMTTCSRNSKSGRSYAQATIVTSHCTVPHNSEARQEAALGEGWARRRTRDLKKSMRESFRKLRRRSTKRVNYPGIQRNLSLNDNNNNKVKVELVENLDAARYEERVVEDRPQDTASAGLIKTVTISLVTNNISGSGRSGRDCNSQSISLFVGTAGGELLCFHSDCALVTNQSNDGDMTDMVTTNNLKLVKQYQLQHRAPVLFMSPMTKDGRNVSCAKSPQMKFDQLLVVTEEQIRIYSLYNWSLKHRLRVTANEGYRLKNAAIISANTDDKLSNSLLSNEHLICTLNNSGQLMMLSSHNLKKKDAVCMVDRSDLLAVNSLTVVTTEDNTAATTTRQSQQPRHVYGMHYSGHGQITQFRIVSKCKSIN